MNWWLCFAVLLAPVVVRPLLGGSITGYQIAALAITGLGLLGFISRRRKLSAE